jgi:hypothetical protein
VTYAHAGERQPQALRRDFLGMREAAATGSRPRSIASPLRRATSWRRAVGFERSRRDRVHAQVVPRPLDRERTRHGEHAGLGARRVHDARHAGPGVGRDDVQDRAFAARDHLLAEVLRAVERAVEHDAEHGTPGVRRQALGGAHEIAGSVVDQEVDLSVAPMDGFRRFTHELRLAHVEHDAVGAPPFLACFGEERFVVRGRARRDHHRRAQGRQSAADLEPQTRAAAE